MVVTRKGGAAFCESAPRARIRVARAEVREKGRQMHGRRAAYYIVNDEKKVQPDASPQPGDADPESVPSLRFGRLFGRTEQGPRPEDRADMEKKLTRLGELMNTATGQPKGDSDIPSGYTYLGQFIAHEVTHDSTGDLLVAGLDPKNLSTPVVDLDSLYGGGDGPTKFKHLYKEDGVRLKTDDTVPGAQINATFPNDLPRGTQDSPDGKKKGNPKEALLGDSRNDENLAVAQTQVAFIHFHNKVVDALEPITPPAELFRKAREEVIRHYQWIILYDFLPRIIRADVLDCVMRHGLRWFKGRGIPYMPLEFSAAAFRIGHTMVRSSYEWNPLNRTDKHGQFAIPLTVLFRQTGFLAVAAAQRAAAGAPGASDTSLVSQLAQPILDNMDNLTSDWVIDWRHFYDFSPLGHVRRVPKRNHAAKLDTNFDLHLDTIEGFPSPSLDKMQQAITARNLLRGFYLELPTGEEAAEWIGETPLRPGQVATGPHKEVLGDTLFQKKTPLWYYVLKEAELLGFNENGEPGNRLGPVGSRIVAETLVGLITHSPHSIIRDKYWRPTFGLRTNFAVEPAKFEMIDLLNFADVVDPLARYYRQSVPFHDLEEG